MPEKTIMHIDMDAYFASVEQRDNKKLRDKPIAVIGSNSRFVLVSPSYEARAFGVKTGMTKLQAQRLCPDIILIKANTEKYADTCSKLLKLLYAFSPDIEVYSIDEFFIDITHTMHLFGTPEEIAEKIREKIVKEVGLSCSIGISHNKLLAKFASEKRKPGGTFTIEKKDVPSLFEDLAPDELWGIGSKTKEALQGMGIDTLGKLSRSSSAALKRKFGINGIKLHLMSQGIDDSLVVPVGFEEEAKSIGHSMTFPEDTSDTETLKRYLLELCDKVGRRLRRANLYARNIKLTIRYKSFKSFTRQRTLASQTDDTKSFYNAAKFILSSTRLKEPVRLLGVSVGKLTSAGIGGFLFEDGKRKYKLNKLIDLVNEHFGEQTVSFASLLGPKKHERIISPAWRPYGKRNY
ncbi:MAG: DNA polymerase IV [Candidatus Omnitrophota bacterium]